MAKSTLPITGVVLYSHGMGFFTRYGKLVGDQEVVLEFKASEMNDVLRSLIPLDHDGGYVASISYDSEESLSDQLKAYSFNVDDSLASLLNQFKGAEVVVTYDDCDGDEDEMCGAILGVSTRTVVEDGVTRPADILSVFGEDGITQIDLAEAKCIQLDDDSLQKDLNHILALLLSSKKKDLKRLSIFVKAGDDPEAERGFMVAHAGEAPLWKTSYRILVDEEDGEDETMLQGWAHIDNTTEEDWQDVNLALVAGSPLSFRHDLYKARYKLRPKLENTENFYSPELALECLEMPVAAAYNVHDSRARGRMSKSASPMMASTMGAFEDSVGVETSTQEIGDLFHYKIDNPVTVRRGQSAAVPLVQQKFHGNKVLHYDARSHSPNPKSAIYFRNNTGKTLEGGPVTVLEQGEYAGDCFLHTIHKKDKQLLPFSVQLGVKIRIDDQKSQDLQAHSLMIKDGYLEVKSYRIRSTSYVIENKTDRAYRLFLDHSHLNKWEFVDTAQPYSWEDNFSCFDIQVGANATQTFTIKERGEQTDRRGLLNIDEDRFDLWIKGGIFSEEINEKLLELRKYTSDIREISQTISTLEAEIKDLKVEEERCARLRAEVKGDVSPKAIELDNSYLTSLEECRDAIKTKLALVVELKQQKADVESLRKDFMNGIDFSISLT